MKLNKKCFHLGFMNYKQMNIEFNMTNVLYLKSLVMFSKVFGSFRRSARVSEAFFTSTGQSAFSEASDRHTTSKYSGKA